MFKEGDIVDTSGEYPNINSDFENGYGVVTQVEEVNLGYAGNQFVTVKFGWGTKKYYANALEKATRFSIFNWFK